MRGWKDTVLPVEHFHYYKSVVSSTQKYHKMLIGISACQHINIQNHYSFLKCSVKTGVLAKAITVLLSDDFGIYNN